MDWKSAGRARPPKLRQPGAQVVVLREENVRLKEKLRVVEEEMKRCLGHHQDASAEPH